MIFWTYRIVKVLFWIYLVVFAIMFITAFYNNFSDYLLSLIGGFTSLIILYAIKVLFEFVFTLSVKDIHRDYKEFEKIIEEKDS